MTEQNATELFPIPLYHGTSTLFLKDILELGLGGKNPLKEWRVLEFAEKIWPLVENSLADDVQLAQKIQTFGKMVEQTSGEMNFQHGDTYLTPEASTAMRYAINKRYGSELLTYTLDFLCKL